MESQSFCESFSPSVESIDSKSFFDSACFNFARQLTQHESSDTKEQISYSTRCELILKNLYSNETLEGLFAIESGNLVNYEVKLIFS